MVCGGIKFVKFVTDILFMSACYLFSFRQNLPKCFSESVFQSSSKSESISRDSVGYNVLRLVCSSSLFVFDF